MGQNGQSVWVMDDNDTDGDDDEANRLPESSEPEILECTICNKSFQSIAQLIQHEGSKVHRKN